MDSVDQQPEPPWPQAGASADRLIRGPAGRIEALLAAPRVALARPAFAVICHPHPLFGGAMSNKVVYTLSSAAQKAGLHTLRFNFRGVGESQGTHDEGRGETEDLLFLVEWMRQRLPAARAVLAGFSFGAFVSLQAAARARPDAQVSIAPPFRKYCGEGDRGGATAGELPTRPPCPWLVMHGRDDEVVPFEPTRAILQSYAPPPRLVVTEGAGHFFHGQLNEISTAVLAFLQEHLA